MGHLFPLDPDDERLSYRMRQCSNWGVGGGVAAGEAGRAQPLRVPETVRTARDLLVRPRQVPGMIGW